MFGLFTNLTSDEIIKNNLAAQFHITIYDLALNWNHIHFLILIKDRQDYVKFIRALTSILSQKIKLKFGKGTEVFELRPFTRILEWGRDFRNTLNYLLTNQLESVGLIKRLKKQKKSKQVTIWVPCLGVT